MTRAIRTGIRISAIFVTLPSLIDSLRSSTNSWRSLKTWKDILAKFVRSVLYIALFSATPSIIISIFSKLLNMNILKSKLWTFISVLVGGTIGFIVETPYRHFQFLGYFTPKAIETIFNILARKGYYKWHWWHKHAVLLLAFAMISFCMSYRHTKQIMTQQTERTIQT